MKNFIKLFTFFMGCGLLSSCSKYVGAYDASTSTTTTTTTTASVLPQVKFFNVMDFGSTNVTFNGKTASSVANYYPSTYIQGVEGSNTLQLSLPNKTQLLSVSLVLLRDTKYSCFFYKVGNEWKYSLMKDDMATALNTGFAAYRILDFRTQGYFDYINVRLVNPGSEIIDSKGRNFLDHNTYGSYTQFKQISAGTYNIFMYNDTLTTSQRKGVEIASKGYYSIILTTPSNITPYSNAIFYIFPDAQKH